MILSSNILYLFCTGMNITQGARQVKHS